MLSCSYSRIKKEIQVIVVHTDGSSSHEGGIDEVANALSESGNKSLLCFNGVHILCFLLFLFRKVFKDPKKLRSAENKIK